MEIINENENSGKKGEIYMVSHWLKSNKGL